MQSGGCSRGEVGACVVVGKLVTVDILVASGLIWHIWLIVWGKGKRLQADVVTSIVFLFFAFILLKGI